MQRYKSHYVGECEMGGLLFENKDIKQVTDVTKRGDWEMITSDLSLCFCYVLFFFSYLFFVCLFVCLFVCFTCFFVLVCLKANTEAFLAGYRKN